MRKLILTFLSAAFLIGCGGHSDKGNQSTAQEEEEIVEEIITNDSLTTVMEQTKEDIDTKTKELDELINDL